MFLAIYASITLVKGYVMPSLDKINVEPTVSTPNVLSNSSVSGSTIDSHPKVLKKPNRRKRVSQRGMRSRKKSALARKRKLQWRKEVESKIASVRTKARLKGVDVDFLSYTSYFPDAVEKVVPKLLDIVSDGGGKRLEPSDYTFKFIVWLGSSNNVRIYVHSNRGSARDVMVSYVPSKFSKYTINKLKKLFDFLFDEGLQDMLNVAVITRVDICANYYGVKKKIY